MLLVKYTWSLYTRFSNVVMIQETKKECDRRFVGSIWTVKNKDWAALPASGASSGILIIWDSNKLRSEEVVIGSFSISVKFALDGCGPLWLTVVYGPNSLSLRKDFWVELLDIFGISFPLWCIGGDFNVIRRSSEKLGGSSLTSSMKDFDDFIRECELLDPPLRNAPFTWSNMQESPVCKDWIVSFTQMSGSFPFLKAFKKFFLEELRIIGRLFWKPIRSSGAQHLLGLRICGCNILASKSALKVGGVAFKELGGKATSGGLSTELIIQRALRKEELEELILREEIHWRQKARVKWVKEGDCNSKFFHKVANGRRNRKFIKVLENESGVVLNDSESIIEEILHYFEKLYSGHIGEPWRVEGLDWSPISEEMFQDCWDVIKEDLVRVIAEFHSRGIINQSTNASFIVLLPKKRHLRGVLHETIHSTQGAFVQGRQILDAVLIANEIVDEKRRSGEEGVILKIDFEKAYDHVSWDFLDQVLEKKGFSPRWRKWMRGCLSSVSFAVLVNGNAKGWVKTFRGLRQGNPLSPFLFTLVAYILNDTIFFSNTSEEDLQTLKSLLLVFGQISGLKVNLDKSNIYGINLEQNHLSRLAELLDCKASGWPIHYLGPLLGGNPKACGFWDPVIERILKRLDGWQRLFYLLEIPASVAAKIERLQIDFLWSGVRKGKRDHLVSWDVVCKPKTIGGLGFGKIALRNVALLGK
ncbi:Transposon TX1 uncharacterized 149 kDa protein [Vitis vinifera]|uniref:Transposon TX1 uncharacterized 149 kDa protein n=1 Tax=Vitis vinifera TaxID=29760 RepID=A0A438KKG6_VITVI|nr:Transposon TX1 uncharacterized 149 kDa protein [Vitis vinifera]